LEVRIGPRVFRIGLTVLAVAALTFLYDWRAFKNMSTQEAMDSAQVGRNLAQGRGFSTSFIRPLSIFLVKHHNQQSPTEPANASDPARLKGAHPDLANPPLYPLVLAGLMKILPFHYPVSQGGFWTYGGAFWRYEPDFLITLFNQLLFLGLVVSVFFLARRLFDAPVAWLSTVLLLGGELYWRFTVSGLSTILLLLIFTGLTGCLALLEEESHQPKWGPNGSFLLAGVIGALVGLGGLTRYGFGWLILPVVTFLILFANPRQRAALILVVLGVFSAVMGVWIARNLWLSGAPFGTAGYSVLEGTSLFPENRLLRSLEPDFSRLALGPLWVKLMANTREIIQNALPKLGGTWVSAFFLVGLLVNFRNPSTRRLRYFLLMCLPVLGVVQALGRTQLSDASPEINSENYLVLLAPLVLVYGIGLFFLLLDQVELPVLQLRYVVIGLFGAIACLPLVLVFLPPRPQPVAYPPYMPPAIQKMSGYMNENELMMSDIPWAVAWYGRRQCAWLTLHAMPSAKDNTRHEDFFAINDFLKPIQALYLTAESMDSKFVSQWVQAGEQSWGSFVAETVLLSKEPVGFPLRKAQAEYFPYQLFLTDWERWKR
jgi:4-amino-4-deoxy-L-arabinose transferase-like glycosyltransferase